MTQTPQGPGDEDRPQDPYGQQPDHGQPSYGSPEYGQPQYDQPPYGQPEQGQSSYGQPEYGYGQPQYGPPQYGQPQYGQPPYGQPPGYPPVRYAPDHPRATTALVLGILGVVLCSLLAPFAWRIGKQTVDEIDDSNGQLAGRGAAQAGYVMGIIGSVILGLSLLVLVGFFVLALVAGVATSSG